MSLAQFIKDNTNDGTDVASVLIDVLNDRIDGCKVSHRLTAARLLIIYGHEDASDFIADNATPGRERRDKQWMTIDPALTRLIRIKTDDGRDMCRLLIDVLHGRAEGANPGHRVSAARELLSRAFGKAPTRPLPKPHAMSKATSPRTPIRGQYPDGHGEALAPDSSPLTPQSDTSEPAAKTAILAEPEQDLSPEEEARRRILFDLDNDPRYTIFDSEIYGFMNECDDPDFDPYLAALDEDYVKSYTGCNDPECEVHGESPEIDFDPNDFHY